MRLTVLLLLPVLACTVATVGCTKRQPPPPPAPLEAPKPVSGWTAQQSEETAATLVEALTADGWVSRFRETNGRMPVIEVATFEDRSADHVPVEALAAEFVRRLATSDRVLAASAGQVADVTLTGVVGLKDATYTIDARISDKRGDVQWLAGVTRPRATGN